MIESIAVGADEAWLLSSARYELTVIE